MAVRKEVIELKAYLVELRRNFHRYPELSGKEYQTALRIEKELEEMGIPHIRVGETGVIGILENDSCEEETQTIILRADIDALSIEEQNKVAYKSQNPGVMHACGHDGHTVALLGAAKVLSQYKANLKQRVILLFQQAEEIGAGAKQFLGTKYWKPIDKIMGIHFASFLPTGKILVQTGESNASCDYFKIIVKGRSCHVSKPQDGIDALYIGSQIVVGIQAVAARMTNPLDPVVVGIGKMYSGTNYNIVANRAVLEGTTRAFNHTVRSKINEAVMEIAISIARAYGAEVEVQFESYAAPLINHCDVAKEIAGIMGQIVGKQQVIVNGPKTMMADDFAEYLQVMKGSYIFVGSSHNEATSYPHHHEQFDLDEEALLIAADAYISFVLGDAPWS
ncbi:MAG: amidohydrolase [Cellulosilyticum sp.]|nr:amidohydrolase [Cellulosilyticum sp.]